MNYESIYVKKITYKTILINLRLGTESDADTNILKIRMINLNSHNTGER